MHRLTRFLRDCALLTFIATASCGDSKMRVDDVRAAVEAGLNGKGFRRSIRVQSVDGVSQTRDSATIIVRIAHVEPNWGRPEEKQITIPCARLNDGGWLCSHDTFPESIRFFIHQ